MCRTSLGLPTQVVNDKGRCHSYLLSRCDGVVPSPGLEKFESGCSGRVTRYSENAVTEAAPDLCTDRRLIRPISARSIAAARRVTQDYARPFCTVKVATARGFRENLTTNLGSRPGRAS